jgi:hypothetical protein
MNFAQNPSALTTVARECTPGIPVLNTFDGEEGSRCGLYGRSEVGPLVNRKRSSSREEVVVVADSSDDEEFTSVDEVSAAISSLSGLKVTYFSPFSK